METNKVVFDTNAQCCDISNEIIKKETMKNGIIYDEIDFNRYPHSDKVQLILGDDYEIKVEDGKTYVVKKQPKYPNTYQECCKVMNINTHNELCIESPEDYIDYYENKLFDKVNALHKLLICRDAYWKIAGDWKPNFKDMKASKYTIGCVKNDILCLHAIEFNRILSFPTKEMRDAFYENFTDLIEQCKEFL